MPENETIIEKDVHQRHQKRGVNDDFGVGKPHIQRAEQEVEAYENNAVVAVLHKLFRHFQDVGGGDDAFQENVGAIVQQQEQHRRQRRHHQQAVFEHRAHLRQVVLAKPPRHNNLNARRETPRQRRKDVVVESRHHRGSQLYLSEMPEKCRIHKRDDRLRQIPRHNRQG